jgi:hypothetical protein
MANRNFNHAGVATLDSDLVKLYGSVLLAASTAVTSQSCNGFTVTALGVGTLTITLEDAFPTFIGAVLTPQCATAVDNYWHIVTASPTTKSITIRCLTGATATAPLAGSTLHIELTLRNSATPRKGV